MKREYVEHFVSGENAWKLGFLGFLIRERGKVFAAFLTLVLISSFFFVPTIWPKFFPKKIIIDLRLFLIFILATFGIFYIFGIRYLRFRSIRSQKIKNQLHGIAHFLRDNQTKTYKASKSEKDLQEYHRNDFYSFINGSCERIKDYFVSFTKDKTVCVAIRLASIDKVNGEDRIFYKTVGRSSGLNPLRAEDSEAIGSDEGIPKFLIHQKCEGVLVFNDLLKASEAGAYKITKNDNKFPGEIKSMCVAPLNGWDGESQTMLGIIYITSRRKEAFSPKIVDLVRFTADTMSKSFSIVVEKLSH